jgi:hypothetical protein
MAFFSLIRRGTSKTYRVSIPVSIVAGTVALLILFSLLECVNRRCCGRSKPRVVPNTLIATAIPSNVTGQRIRSWTSLQENGNEVGRNGVGRNSRRDSVQPPMYNSLSHHNERTAPRSMAMGNAQTIPSQCCTRIPSGPSRAPRPPKPSYSPPYPLPPAAPR